MGGLEGPIRDEHGHRDISSRDRHVNLEGTRRTMRGATHVMDRMAPEDSRSGGLAAGRDEETLHRIICRMERGQKATTGTLVRIDRAIREMEAEVHDITGQGWGRCREDYGVPISNTRAADGDRSDKHVLRRMGTDICRDHGYGGHWIYCPGKDTRETNRKTD